MEINGSLKIREHSVTEKIDRQVWTYQLPLYNIQRTLIPEGVDNNDSDDELLATAEP